MPLTPFHWGLPLLAGELLFKPSKQKRRCQLIGVLLASLPDVEGFLALVVGVEGFSVHGALHSFTLTLLMGIVATILLTIVSNRAELFTITRGEQFFYLTSPLVFHTGLDLLAYPEIPLLWPLDLTNPFAVSSGYQLGIFIGMATFALALGFSSVKTLNARRQNTTMAHDPPAQQP